jgi:hypothetical protein
MAVNLAPLTAQMRLTAVIDHDLMKLGLRATLGTQAQQIGQG